MSASKQKKIRQEQANTGYVDPKLEKLAKEKKEQRKINAVYIVIAAIFVVVALCLIFVKSGYTEKHTAAVTINGEKFTAPEVNYYYMNSVNSIYSSSYASYMGFNTETRYDEQELNDTAKLLLGVSDDDSIVTWDDYFRSSALSTLRSTYAAYDKAVSEGKTYDEHVNEDIKSADESLASYAKQYGYSAKQYVKAVYGKNMTMDTFHKLLKMSAIAEEYGEEFTNGLTYTDAEMEAFFQSEKEEFEVADYEYIYFSSTLEATYDENGDAVEATEEETQAAIDAAKENAEAALARIQEGEAVETVAEDYENGSYSKVEAGSHYDDNLSAWVFDEAHADGDAGIVESINDYYVVLFHNVGRNDYNTVDVRHCLIKANTDDIDPESATYDEEVQGANDEALATANYLLAQWKEGGAKEEDFAVMADENSSDSAEGGLYEKVYKGQMVTEFNDWIFDASRKAGDTDIVKTSYGYHIMYFVGQNLPYWKIQVSEDMQNHDYNDWMEDLISGYEVVESTGMKYVGQN